MILSNKTDVYTFVPNPIRDLFVSDFTPPLCGVFFFSSPFTVAALARGFFFSCGVIQLTIAIIIRQRL